MSCRTWRMCAPALPTYEARLGDKKRPRPKCKAKHASPRERQDAQDARRQKRTALGDCRAPAYGIRERVEQRLRPRFAGLLAGPAGLELVDRGDRMLQVAGARHGLWRGCRVSHLVRGRHGTLSVPFRASGLVSRTLLSGNAVWGPVFAERAPTAFELLLCNEATLPGGM